jgi:hypothetical protein
MVSFLDQKIEREWRKLRAIDFAHAIYFDDAHLILSKFNKIKDLIIQVIQGRSVKAIKTWLRDHALYYGEQGDIKRRNVWLDLRECFDYLEEQQLLQGYVNDSGNEGPHPHLKNFPN